MNCPNCGAEVPMRARFCPSCGMASDAPDSMECDGELSAEDTGRLPALHLAEDKPRKPVVVTNATTDNPNVDADFMTSEEFLRVYADGNVDEVEAVFIDVSALPRDLVNLMASQHNPNVSFFYTQEVPSGELGSIAVNWNPLTSEQKRIRTALETGDYENAMPAANEPERIVINGKKSALVSSLLTKRWPVAFLVIAAIVCGLFSTLWWAVIAVAEPDMVVTPTFSKVFSIVDVTTVVCLVAALLLCLVRQVCNTGELLRFYGSGISKAGKLSLVARAIVSMAFLVVLAAAALYLFLGAGGAQRLPAAMMSNPLIMWLINIVSSLEFIAYIVPMRFVVGIVVPVLFAAALILIIGGPILAAFTHFGSLGVVIIDGKVFDIYENSAGSLELVRRWL